MDYIEIRLEGGKGGYLIPDTKEGKKIAEELMKESGEEEEETG